MKRLDGLQLFFSALLTLISLAVLCANALNAQNILGSTVMAVAVGVIAWIAKRRSNAVGIWIGAVLFAAIFGWIDYMGWMAK